MLFDLDEAAPKTEPKTARSKGRRPPKKTETVEHLDGMDPPEPAYVSPAQHDPNGDRIADVCQRIKGGEMVGEFRLDAVAHALCVMLFRQIELATNAPHCSALHPKMSDDDLGQSFGWAYERLQMLHGETLFPPMPIWEPPDLRRWVQLWHGTDMIGRFGLPQHDHIAEVFQFAGPMGSKQKAWGAYYTPFSVCLMMAMMTASDEPWLDSLVEPCCGAGSMIVAVFFVVRDKLMAAQKAGTMTGLEATMAMTKWVSGVSAQDIDGEAVWTCAAQLATRAGYPVSSSRHPYRGES